MINSYLSHYSRKSEGIKISCSSTVDEAQLWNSDPGSFNILLRSVIDCMITESLHPQLITPSFFSTFFFSRRIKGMRRVENNSRDRGHAECQAICLAIPDVDHADPGNADARLSGETRKSNRIIQEGAGPEISTVIAINQISN